MKRSVLFALIIVLAIAVASIDASARSNNNRRHNSGPVKATLAGIIAAVEVNGDRLQFKINNDLNGSQMVFFADKGTKITVDGKSDPKHEFKAGEHVNAATTNGMASSIAVSTKDADGDGFADAGGKKGSGAKKPAAPK